MEGLGTLISRAAGRNALQQDESRGERVAACACSGCGEGPGRMRLPWRRTGRDPRASAASVTALRTGAGRVS